MFQWLWKKFDILKIDIVWFKGLKFSSTQGATKSPVESLRDSVPTSIKMKSKVPDLSSKKKIDDALKSSVPSALSPDEPQRVHETGNKQTILLNEFNAVPNENYI